MPPLNRFLCGAAAAIVCWASSAVGETTVIYVNAAATGANNGTSWADAFVDLHDALDAAAEPGSGTQIWVAAGEYVPGPADEDPQSSFHLVSGVAMYGGFAGWETKLDQREWQTNETVLRRDVPAPSVFSAAPILVGEYLSSGSLLDGLIIRDGYNWSPHGPGALRLVNSHLTIVNCVFINNRTSDVDGGGAIYAAYSALEMLDTAFLSNRVLLDQGGALSLHACALVAIQCDFVANQAGSAGAISATEDSLLLLNKSVFAENEVDVGAPAVFFIGTVHATGCVFAENVGDSHAVNGGLSLAFENSLIIENSMFDSNSGAVSVHGDVAIIGSTFIGNVYEFAGPGGVRQYGSGSVMVTDSVFEQNHGYYGGAIWAASPAVVANTRIADNTSNQFPAGIIADADLTIIDSEIVDNSSMYPFETAGGIGIENGHLDMINTLITHNWPQGVRIGQGATGSIVNSTIAHNGLFDFNQNAGLWVHPASNADLRNSIVWGNGPIGGSCTGACGGLSFACWCDESCCDFNDCCGDKLEVCGGCVPTPYTDNEIVSHQINGPAKVSHSIIHGLAPGSIYDIPGANNSGDDPLFVDPLNDDFRLQPGSPAIDAGDNSFVPDPDEFPGVETDLDGNPRIIDGNNDGLAIVDLGAYEFQPSAPSIPGDLNGDGSVGVADLLILLTSWGPCANCDPQIPGACPADLTGDCNVGVSDLLILLQNWG